jgi:hypothetical protein
MRRIDELLRELGFNSEAPTATQTAFVRHLMRAAQKNSQLAPATLANKPTEEIVTPPTSRQEPEIQLSFDPEILRITKAGGAR